MENLRIDDLFTPFPNETSLGVSVTLSNGRVVRGLTNFSEEKYRKLYTGRMTEEGGVECIVFRDESVNRVFCKW